MIRAKKSVILEITKDDYDKIYDFQNWMYEIDRYLERYGDSGTRTCINNIIENINRIKNNYMECI